MLQMQTPGAPKQILHTTDAKVHFFTIFVTYTVVHVDTEIEPQIT